MGNHDTGLIKLIEYLEPYSKDQLEVLRHSIDAEIAYRDDCEEEPEIDQEMIENQYEDIDDVERLFIAAKLIYIDRMGGLQ